MQGLHFIEHVLRTILRTVLAIFLTFPIAALVGAGAVEGVGSLTTHQFPAPIQVHVLALAFAVVVGYAAALTYAVIESIIGAVRIGESLERDFFRQGTVLEKTMQQFEHFVAGR